MIIAQNWLKYILTCCIISICCKSVEVCSRYIRVAEMTSYINIGNLKNIQFIKYPTASMYFLYWKQLGAGMAIGLIYSYVHISMFNIYFDVQTLMLPWPTFFLLEFRGCSSISWSRLGDYAKWSHLIIVGWEGVSQMIKWSCIGEGGVWIRSIYFIKDTVT